MSDLNPSLGQPALDSYVLMTAAHNEELFIEATIQSVLAQTCRPIKWVIVNDNSDDNTRKILDHYARQCDFLQVLHLTRAPGRNFGLKVEALHNADRLLETVPYEFIGNLDADISLEARYFEQLIECFHRQPSLGLAGGFLWEQSGGQYRSLRLNHSRNVAHASQLLRRECYKGIGGYAVLKYGGEDWYAQTTARMNGWHVEAFPHLKIFHHRSTTGGSTPLRNAFRLGKLDYSFGSDPVFEVVKCLRRLPEKPYVGSAFARLAGFLWLYICRESKTVPEDFALFLQRDQKRRILRLLNCRRTSWTSQPDDSLLS